MRFKSKPVGGYCIYAVAGTNSASFAIDFSKANTNNLLGFAVKRTYLDGTEHFLPGLKVFERNAKAVPGKLVSTETDPIQSFVWDDFTLEPANAYTYTFIPMKGKKDDLKAGTGIPIKIKTEQAFSDGEHDVFFNRGVASSQAYARKFQNTPPDELVGKKKQEAFEWLGRDLYPAILKFIGQAKKGDTLWGAFYEFNYPGVLDAFKVAIDNGVNVTLVIDMKNNKHKVKNKIIPSSPRESNIKALKEAKIPKANTVYREANKNMIHHNKFIVYGKGKSASPTAVWLGSTNITESGIFGQTNVGHWVRNEKTAATYKNYWDILSKDPGGKDDDEAADKKKKVAAYKKSVSALQEDILEDIKKGVTPVFSPRVTLKMLAKYFQQIDKATESSVITLAFGITADLKDLLLEHNADSAIGFMMLEKQDKATKKNAATFRSLSAKNNIYQAFGSYLPETLYNWTRETNNKRMNVTKLCELYPFQILDTRPPRRRSYRDYWFR